ncbi:MAG: type II toxin-antitoxin system RelE/ParE family toxin [Dehalococcoidia bacterium]
MMYRIELRRLAQRALDRLQKADFQAVVEAVNDLAQTPRPRRIEKVKGTDLWRIRQGDYRIVYAIDDNQQLVTVVHIGHRREIYRSL